jgi:hypothetical protein
LPYSFSSLKALEGVAPARVPPTSSTVFGTHGWSRPFLMEVVFVIKVFLKRHNKVSSGLLRFLMYFLYHLFPLILQLAIWIIQLGHLYEFSPVS